MTNLDKTFKLEHSIDDTPSTTGSQPTSVEIIHSEPPIHTGPLSIWSRRTICSQRSAVVIEDHCPYGHGGPFVHRGPLWLLRTTVHMVTEDHLSTEVRCGSLSTTVNTHRSDVGCGTLGTV